MPKTNKTKLVSANDSDFLNYCSISYSANVGIAKW